MKKFFFSTYYDDAHVGLEYDTAEEMIDFLRQRSALTAIWKERTLETAQQSLSDRDFEGAREQFDMLVQVLSGLDTPQAQPAEQATQLPAQQTTEQASEQSGEIQSSGLDTPQAQPAEQATQQS